MTPSIRSKPGQRRNGFTAFPNWRWEDDELDPHELRVMGWLTSHADAYLADEVTRNEIARRTGVSAGKVSRSLLRLSELGYIEVETVAIPQHQGGRRLEITIDMDAWTTQPRSPGDRYRRTGRRSTRRTTII